VLSHAADPSSSLSVTWRTDSTVTGAKAQVALATGGPSFYTQARTVEAETQDLHAHKVTGEHVSANYHSVTFEGLMADTLYAYRVGDGERWSEWFHARTASAEPEPFSFVYVGDAQNNVRSHWSRLIRQAYTDAPEIDFLLHARPGRQCSPERRVGPLERGGGIYPEHGPEHRGARQPRVRGLPQLAGARYLSG
jgi:phosphodiesterase/alkaline phosphatase D-like protein